MGSEHWLDVEQITNTGEFLSEFWDTPAGVRPIIEINIK